MQNEKNAIQTFSVALCSLLFILNFIKMFLVILHTDIQDIFKYLLGVIRKYLSYMYLLKIPIIHVPVENT